MLGTEIKRLFRILWQPSKIQDPYFEKKPAQEIFRLLSISLSPT